MKVYAYSPFNPVGVEWFNLAPWKGTRFPLFKCANLGLEKMFGFSKFSDLHPNLIQAIHGTGEGTLKVSAWKSRVQVCRPDLPVRACRYLWIFKARNLLPVTGGKNLVKMRVYPGSLLFQSDRVAYEGDRASGNPSPGRRVQFKLEFCRRTFLNPMKGALDGILTNRNIWRNVTVFTLVNIIQVTSPPLPSTVSWYWRN